MISSEEESCNWFCNAGIQRNGGLEQRQAFLSAMGRMNNKQNEADEKFKSRRENFTAIIPFWLFIIR